MKRNPSHSATASWPEFGETGMRAADVRSVPIAQHMLCRYVAGLLPERTESAGDTSGNEHAVVWLVQKCSASRKVAGSIPDEVIGFFS
jgi:hypothetical protein